MLANAGREVTRGNRANRYDSVRGRSRRRRTRRRLAHCTCGVLSCRGWKNGFSREAPELRIGKARLTAGPSLRSRKEELNDQIASGAAADRQIHDHYRLAP